MPDNTFKINTANKPLPIIFSLLDTPAFGGAEQYLLAHLYYLALHGYKVVLATNNQAVKDRVLAENVRHLEEGERTIDCIDAPYLLDAIGNWKGLVKYFLSLPWSITWVVLTLLRLKQTSLSAFQALVIPDPTAEKAPAVEKLTEANRIICLLPGFSDRLTFSPFMKWLGCTVLWIEIGPLGPTFKKNWGFPKLLYRLTQWTADHFITTSKFTLKSMVSEGHISEKHITLVYPGINPVTDDQIKQFKKRGRQLKKDSKLERHTLLAFTGRLASENEVELTITAFHLLLTKLRYNEHSHKYHLMIIGDGPERPKYEALVNDLGLSKKVTFTGFISEEDKFSWLSVSDVFTFTRSWELDGFGMTTIEAMSVQTAIVNPRFGPQKEIIEDGKTGIHFQPHSSESLAKKVAYMLNHPDLRQKIAVAGLHHVRKTFSQHQQTHLLHTVVSRYS